MIVSFANKSNTLSNIDKLTFAASTTAINGPLLEANQYCHVQNETSAICFISVGTATENPASNSTAFWKIPPLSDIYFEEIPIGQLNIALSAGTGNVNFVVADRT